MNYSAIIGIDPGYSNGGIACITSGGMYAKPMPKTDKGLWDMLNKIKCRFPDVYAFVEHQHPFPGISSHATWVTAYNYSSIIMAFTGNGIEYNIVTATEWKRLLGIRKRDKEESKTDFKNRLKEAAIELYPELYARGDITLKTSDAILIAAYGQKVLTEKLF
jgi:hypothetical protein